MVISEIISRLKQINPKWSVLVFLLGLTHKQILYLLKKLSKSIRKPIKNKQQEYVGIYVTNTEYSIGVGNPIYNRYRQINDYLLKNQKKAILHSDPKIITLNILSQLQNKKYKFVGVSSYWKGRTLPQRQIDQQKQEQESNNICSQIYQNIQKHIRAQQYGYQSNINVNCLAEYKLGNHHVTESLAYIDVGKQVNISVIIKGRFLKGFQNIQGGHIIVQRHPDQKPGFTGTCSKHYNCVQGYISIQSIIKRCNIDILRLHTIRSTDPVWKLIGFYLAQLCLTITYLLSPETIIVNGDIINRKQILSQTQTQFLIMLNKYITNTKLTNENIKNYISKPKIASSGIKGCMLLQNLS